MIVVLERFKDFEKDFFADFVESDSFKTVKLSSRQTFRFYDILSKMIS